MRILFPTHHVLEGSASTGWTVAFPDGTRQPLLECRLARDGVELHTADRYCWQDLSAI